MLTLIPEEPALLIETSLKRFLVIADLHIGFELGLAERGMNIPSQTGKLLKKIVSLVKRYSPQTILFLGDVKHSVPKISMSEWKDVPEFFEALKNMASLEVVPGNHDGNLEPLTPPEVKFHPSKGVVIKNEKILGLLHGHTWPSPELLKSDVLLVAHNHPMIELRDPLGFRVLEPVWVKAKLSGKHFAEAYLKYIGLKPSTDPVHELRKELGFKVSNLDVIIMPAMNQLLGGISLNTQREKGLLGPLLESGSINIDGADIYLLDGTYLGPLHNLRRFLVGREV